MAWRALNQYDKEANGLSAIDWFEKGDAFQNAGNHKQAIEAYSKGIELDPNDAKAYYNRGVAYAMPGTAGRQSGISIRPSS
jgi:tetratricopeptide (TPR) repeat protein